MASSQTRWLIGCSVAAVFLLGFALVLILAVASLIGTDVGVPGFGSTVAVVEIFGVIGEDDTALEQLDRIAEDGSVAALVLHINSPGGSVATTQRITARLEKFIADGLPVVAAMDMVAASGGYYIACAADSILTLPGTLTGSIGAVMSFPEVSELMRKLGVELQVIKTGAFKDAGSPHRSLTAEERQWLERVLDDVLEQFVTAVEHGRPALERSEIDRLADGRIFSGTMAVDLGLADRLGTLDDAVAVARELAGLGAGARIVRKRPPESFLHRWLEERVPALAPWAAGSWPRLEYRWR